MAEQSYTPGTYEAQLKSQGYNLAEIKQQYDYGKNINPGEYNQITSRFESPISKMRNQAMDRMNQAVNMNYEFDPNQFLPSIQQQASAIYDPQQAQLEAIRLLQNASYQDTKVQTEKQFEDTLKSEIESINNRGAYFSGGAIEREQDINDAKLSALNQLGLQATAADFSNLAQQGLLAAEEAQFIQDRLYNAEASAYNRWTDQRNFSYQAAVQEYQMYTDERNFARSVFESDRSYNLQKEQMDMQRKQFEQEYKISSAQFEMAKEQFNVDMKIKNLSYDQALTKFKQNYAVTNTGILGINSTGGDAYDDLSLEYDMLNSDFNADGWLNSNDINDGGTFDIDSFINN